MQRHDALQDLSRDHHHALAAALRVNRGLDAPEGAGDEVRRELAGELLGFWMEDVEPHFREEEAVLLPLLSRHLSVGADADLPRMLDDHAWLRDRFHVLADRLVDGSPPADLLRGIAERLHDHVRLEERVIFPRVEALLSAAELDELAEGSREFRELHRRPPICGSCRPPEREYPSE